MASFLLHPDAAFHDDAASRFTSMSVTRNPSATILEERRSRSVRVPASLNVDDIQGARPKSLAPLPRSADFSGTLDVEGAQPRVLHRAISYTPEVVEGSMPRATKFRTQRQTDPVAPGHYGLPPAPQPAGVALPYKRDLSTTNLDIAGSQPSAHLPWATRPGHTDVGDIAGASSRPRTLAYQHQHVDANLDVRDINAFRVFRSQRRSDPQRPAFAVHGRVVADEDPGMFVAPPRPAGQHPDFSLTTQDIEGAQASEAKEPMVGGIKPANRREYRVSNYVADIPGASPGSRRRGLASLRGTNPLERDYVLLDGRALDAGELAMGKSWYNAAATVLAAQAGAASATLLTGHSATTAGTAPYMDYARRVMDPRDAELAALRGSASVLRKERDLLHMSQQLARSARAGREGAEYIASGGAAAEAAGALLAAEAAAAGVSTAAAAAAAAGKFAGRQQAHPLVPSLAASSTGAEHSLFAAEAAAAAAAAAEAGVEGSSREAAGGSSSLEATGGSHSMQPPPSPLTHSSSSSSSPRDPFLGDPGASGRGRGWHRSKGVGGLRAGAGATAYAATLGGAPLSSTARGVSSTGAPLLDPVLTLRSTAAPPGVRDLLGVLPATRPPQDLASTASMRESARGKFDRALDAVPSAPRGALPGQALPAAAASAAAAAARGAGERSQRSFVAARARDMGRELAQEIAEVRALPSFKPSKEGRA